MMCDVISFRYKNGLRIFIEFVFLTNDVCLFLYSNDALPKIALKSNGWKRYPSVEEKGEWVRVTRCEAAY